MAILDVQQTLTAERFYDLYSTRDERCELVNGKVVLMSPAGPRHGRFDSRIHRRLAEFVEAHDLGEVFINTGFVLGRNPDVVRGPDQAFVSKERIAANPLPERGFWEIVPDLAVEIVSPDDRQGDLDEKVAEYLRVGVRVVWMVYPRMHQIHVHVPGDTVEIIRGIGVLDGRDVLPGFRLNLAEIWD